MEKITPADIPTEGMKSDTFDQPEVNNQYGPAALQRAMFQQLAALQLPPQLKDAQEQQNMSLRD